MYEVTDGSSKETTILEFKREPFVVEELKDFANTDDVFHWCS